MQSYKAFHTKMTQRNIIGVSEWLIYRRIPWLRPPPFCMLALGKSGEEAYTRDRDISAWRPLPTDECHMGARSLHFLWLFDGQNSRKNDKVRHIMTQMAGLLALATVFVGHRREGGGAYTRDETTCVGTWVKNAGGAYTQGGSVLAGLYGITYPKALISDGVNDWSWSVIHVSRVSTNWEHIYFFWDSYVLRHFISPSVRQLDYGTNYHWKLYHPHQLHPLTCSDSRLFLKVLENTSMI
jgi:hypothetical protein